jgi:hypothetical protein
VISNKCLKWKKIYITLWEFCNVTKLLPYSQLRGQCLYLDNGKWWPIMDNILKVRWHDAAGQIMMLAHRHDDLATCSSAEMVWHNRYDFRIYVLSTNSMLPLFVTNDNSSKLSHFLSFQLYSRNYSMYTRWKHCYSGWPKKHCSSGCTSALDCRVAQARCSQGHKSSQILYQCTC